MSEIFDIAHKSGEVLLLSAAPLLSVLLLVSVVVGLAQSVFQLQDPAIGFVPKLVVLLVACALAGGFLLERFGGLMREAIVTFAGGAL
ncbi:MAG: flagellar biosynthetic protein FliQ [Deltaproteobacteria bacterium]|nr:flagellar biosynthetic protein FliQ [Deltaproteobacteria bacterium]